MLCEVRDVAPGLWIWRIEHPAWSETSSWQPSVTSTCVESRGEVLVIDALAPPDEAQNVWERLDTKPPTVAAVLKPDHVRDVDLFVDRYRCRAFGPWLFWRGHLHGSRVLVFETATFDRSATPPGAEG